MQTIEQNVDLKERIALIQTAGPTTLDDLLIKFGLAKKDVPEKEPRFVDYPDLLTFAILAICIIVLFGLVVGAIVAESELSKTVKLSYFGAVAAILGLEVVVYQRWKWRARESRKKRHEYDKHLQDDRPSVSLLSVVQKRRLVINLFRGIVSDVRERTLGPDSEVMKTETEIRLRLEQAETLLSESLALEEKKTELTPEAVETLNLQIKRQQRLKHNIIRILDAHVAGKQVIIDRLRQFDIALGLFDPNAAVQGIADRTAELEWSVERLEARSTDSLLHVVRTLADYIGHVNNGIQHLAGYTFGNIEVERSGKERVVVHLPEGDVHELRDLLEEVVPDPHQAIVPVL